jgi:hypothetical protein
MNTFPIEQRRINLIVLYSDHVEIRRLPSNSMGRTYKRRTWFSDASEHRLHHVLRKYMQLVATPSGGPLIFRRR